MSSKRPSSPPHRLQSRLLLFFLLVLLVPSLLIPLVTLPYLRDFSRSARIDENLQLVRQQSLLIEQELEIRAVELLLISQLPQMRRWVNAPPQTREQEHEALVRALQSHLLKHPGSMEALKLIQANGERAFRIQSSNPLAVEQTPANLSRHPSFIGALHLNALRGQNLPIYVSHPDPAGPILYSALINRDDGQIAAVLVLELMPMSQLPFQLPEQRGQLLQVFNTQAQPMITGPDLTHPRLSSHAETLLTTPSGTFRDPQGPFFIIHSRIRPPGQSAVQWTALYETPLQMVLAPYQVALRRVLIVTLSTLALALLISALFSREISRPVSRLAVAANDLCHGYWATEIPETRRQDEIGELTQAFRSMSRQLRRAHEELLAKLSELENSRENLARETERLNVTLRSIGDSVVVTNLQGEIVSINPAAETALSLSADQVLRTPFLEKIPLYIHGEDKPYTRLLGEVIRQRLPDLDRMRLELRPPPPAAPVPVHLTASPIRNQEGAVEGAVFVLRDLRALQHALEEKNHLEKLKSLGLLAGGIAHDFNNLMSVLMGDLSLLITSPSPGGASTELLQHALKATQRARTLTGQLLVFSKGGTPVQQNARLPELVRETVAFALHGTASVPEFQIQDRLWEVQGDCAQLHQVFHNLSLNAAQAMTRGGYLRIRMMNVTLEDQEAPPRPGGRYVRVEIEDEGGGIDPEILPNIFDPYFTTKAAGNGLGLSTVHSIVKAHGGTIQVRNTQKGCRFTLDFPASAPAADAAPPAAEPPAPAVSVPPLHMLIVDDDEDLRITASRLIHHLGHNVTQAMDTQSALALCEERRQNGIPFDLAILDLTLPGCGGALTLITRLQEIFPGILTLLSSGYAQDPAMLKPADFGFTASLAKPYSLEELKACIQLAWQTRST